MFFDAKTQSGIPAGALLPDRVIGHQFNHHAVQFKTRHDIAAHELQAKHVAVKADGSVKIRNAIIDCVEAEFHEDVPQSCRTRRWAPAEESARQFCSVNEYEPGSAVNI
jgi:hypothetical protein